MSTAVNLSDLPKTIAKLQRLRGIDSKTLKAAGFDALLDELEAEAAVAARVEALNLGLVEVIAALNLLLSILDQRDDQPLSVSGLYCLMSPLVEKLDRIEDELDALLT